MAKRLVKLVRDNVQQNLSGTEVTYEKLDREIYIRQLRLKLVEEAVEYLDNPCPEELADVIEVVDALSSYDPSVNGSHLLSVMAEKREAKGGFNHGIGMFVELKELDPDTKPIKSPPPWIDSPPYKDNPKEMP